MNGNTAPPLFRQIRGVLAALIICAPLVKAAGEDVSRQPPQIYQDKLAPLLTPLQAVLHARTPEKYADKDGVILLDEGVQYIDENGHRCMAYHRICKAINDSAVKYVAEDVWSYRRTNQKIHLVLAKTIQPDGRQIPVQPGATMMQTPQREADYSLYNDVGELRVIFPDVKPGTITELIVVIEESQFRIPGEFTASFTLAGGWPIQKSRYIIDMPDAMAARLKITTLGNGVPDPKKEQPEKGRQRFTWEAENVPSLPNEINVPPVLQTGPEFLLTTLPDWDAFARWYAPLVGERSAIKPALAAKIDEWTKDAHTPAEVLAILMTRVADDVRYVGLEFGSADLQPHDCNAVWDNQYGDCKDKANLLCAMLEYKGIDASIALLNTDSVGLVEKRSPDYRDFTHAIVAAELEHGKYIFCDPTITYAKPGMLSPNDGDRDVLLIKKNGAEWARTPAAEAGTLRYDFDVKLDPDGGISGWLTVESTGCYALWYADDYERLDKESVRSRAHDILQAFYNGAEITDVTKTPLEKWDGVYKLKMYFVVPGSGRAKQASQTLSFPQAGLLFVNPGSNKKRETPYYLWADTVKVTAHIKLPAGLAPSELPQPYKLESPPLDATALWNVKGQECSASLEIHTKQNFIQPDQFAVFYNSLLSLHAWLDNPLSLSASGETRPETDQQEITLENFPMMPTGEGQLALVDQRYPDSGNLNLRREALKKVMQYFPADKTTLYNAGISLALVDWDEHKAKEAADQINSLLKMYRGSVGTEDVAWGEYMLARIYQDTQQSAEAQKILEHMANDTAVSQRRRAWAGYQLALLLEDKTPAAAIKVLRQGLALKTDAQPAEFTLLVKLLIVTGHMDTVKQEIAQLLGKKPPHFAAMLTNLAESAGDLLPASKAAARTELVRILDDAGKSADLGKQFDDAMQASRDTINAVTVAARVRDSLMQYLAKNPPMKLDAEAAHFKTRADFSRAIDAAEKDRKPEWCLRYGIEQLVRFESDADFPAYLWKTAGNADWNERFHDKPEPLLPVLLDLCDKLPTDNEGYIEGRFLRAKVCIRKGDIAGALKIHEDLSHNPKLPQSYKITADERMAANLESLRDYKKALTVYHDIESEIQYVGAKDCLLRAVFLNLEAGNRDEAFRLLSLLDGRSPDAIKQADTGWQILELTALAKDRKRASAYWDSSAKWWPAWLALEQKLGMKPQGDEQMVPSFPVTANLYNEMDSAARAKNRDGFFQNLRKVAHGARWEPALTIDLARMNLFDTTDLVPACADDIRRFTIEMCENLVTDDPALIRKKQFYRTVASIDTNQYAKAIETIHEFESKPQENDFISQVMARLWGAAAQREKSELVPAIGALEKSLSGGDPVDSRAMSVTLLADLYRLAGRADDEEKLLKREMDNPQIKSSTQDLQTITARHDQLAKEGTDSRQLSQAVEHWLQKHKPVWYDFAEPKSLDDPRLSNLDELLKDPGQVFTTPEIIKLQILLASSASQPYERRQQAFLDALDWLEDFSLTKQETKDLYEPVVDNDEFPDGVRLEVLWRAIFNARREERTADFEKLVAHSLEKDFNDRTKATCDIFHEVLAIDQSSPEAVAAFCDKLLQKELTPASLKELRIGYERLLLLTQTDAAEKIYKRLADATLNADVGTGKASLQLDFLKSLNRTKKWLPMAAAMRKLVLAQYPAESIKEPAVYSTLRDTVRFFQLDEETSTQMNLYLIKTQQFDVADFDFWYYFVRNLPRTEANGKLALDLIASALENAPGDIERAGIVKDALSMVDIDNPGQREAVMKMEQQYRKPEELPETYASIRTQEIRWAWRSGQPVEMETDFATLHTSDTRLATTLKLSYYVQTRNIPLLKKMLESLSPDYLLSDPQLEISIDAFNIAGMKDELELARQAAKKAIYRSVLQSWAIPGVYPAGGAYRLSGALHDTSGIPQEWFDYENKRIANHYDNMVLRSEDALLHEDWPRLLATMNEAVSLFPTFYHFYWLKGLALYRMGKTQEAVEPFQTYTKYSKDESEYPQATEWLGKIQSAAKQ